MARSMDDLRHIVRRTSLARLDLDMGSDSGRTNVVATPTIDSVSCAATIEVVDNPSPTLLINRPIVGEEDRITIYTPAFCIGAIVLDCVAFVKGFDCGCGREW